MRTAPRPNPCSIITKCSASPKMKVVLLLLPLIAAVITAPEARFTCEECVREMHGLAAMVKMGAIPIHDYLRDNYCPTLDSTAAQHFCEDSLSKYYVGMLVIFQNLHTCPYFDHKSNSVTEVFSLFFQFAVERYYFTDIILPLLTIKTLSGNLILSGNFKFAVVEHYFVDGGLHVCQTAGTCQAREYTCEECVQGLQWVEAYLEDPIMVAEFRIYLEQNFCLSKMDLTK